MAIRSRFLSRFLLFALVVMAGTVTAHAQRSQRPETAGGRDGSYDSGQKATRTLSQRQIENMQSRIALATAIVDRLASDAKAQGRGAAWRQVTLESLLALPLTQLERVQQEAHSADGVPRAIRAASSDPNLLGNPAEDLVYTPIPPCRFVDTRIVAGRFTGFREYDIAEPGSTYGGSAFCQPTVNFGTSDDEIGALAMNLTIIDPAIAPGFAAAKPTPSAPLSSQANWYEVGPTVQAANQGAITMDMSAADPEFVVQTSATVHVIVDIFGAFLAPEATALEVVSVRENWSILSPLLDFDETATCPAGYAITGGGYAHTTGVLGGVLVFENARDGTDHGWRCRGISLSVLPLNFSGFCEAICARTPGR